jgi:undecaprenyl-diphosphatase
VAGAPGSSGRLALHLRFLQKEGLDREAAATAAGVEGGFSLVVQVVLLFLALETAEQRGIVELSVPALVVVGALVALRAAVAAAAALVPSARRLVRDTVLPGLARTATAAREVAGRPARLAALTAGTLLAILAHVAALVVCVEVFGGTTAPIVVAIVLLVGALVTAVSPTPGGLGFAEVTLIVGLRTAGESPAVAVPAVFLFRLAVFWLPILPAWWATRRLQVAGEL